VPYAVINGRIARGKRQERTNGGLIGDVNWQDVFSEVQMECFIVAQTSTSCMGGKKKDIPGYEGPLRHLTCLAKHTKTLIFEIVFTCQDIFMHII